jgi:hypothetical protein
MNEDLPEIVIEPLEPPGKPYVAITVFMALLTVLVPFAASYLDLKDANKASE